MIPTTDRRMVVGLIVFGLGAVVAFGGLEGLASGGFRSPLQNCPRRFHSEAAVRWLRTAPGDDASSAAVSGYSTSSLWPL